jgi:hypothetical protein
MLASFGLADAYSKVALRKEDDESEFELCHGIDEKVFLHLADIRLQSLLCNK